MSKSAIAPAALQHSPERINDHKAELIAATKYRYTNYVQENSMKTSNVVLGAIAALAVVAGLAYCIVAVAVYAEQLEHRIPSTASTHIL